MVQKRPFEDEEQYEISAKLPKQLKHNDQLSLFSEIKPSGDKCPLYNTVAGEGGFKDREDVHESFAGDHLAKHHVEYEEDTDYSEDDAPFHDHLRVPFLPEYFYPECGVRALAQREDMYNMHLQLPPQKPVPIGPNHQADIPHWNPDGGAEGSSSSNVCSTFEVVSNCENEGFMGIPVIPMPDDESCHDEVVAGRTECKCYDKGSMRCVRQHVMEARKKLERNLGTEKFEDLGFLDMGEQVADKWTEEEEQLFLEVVFSNPPSLGRNFWNILSSTFPSRTKMEIVSYYFNVFVLRQRAEQNRFDPLGADSDNDEWRVIDEDDDDSVVESPSHNIGLDNGMEDDANEVDGDAADKTDDENEDIAFDTDEKGYREVQDHTTSKCQDKAWDAEENQEHQEANEDSCTSFENGAAALPSGSQLKDENQDQWSSGCNGISNSSSTHMYGIEHCDAKLWDVGYMSSAKRDVDFLPTCSMIEEVFGDGSSNCKIDGKGPVF